MDIDFKIRPIKKTGIYERVEFRAPPPKKKKKKNSGFNCVYI